MKGKSIPTSHKKSSTKSKQAKRAASKKDASKTTKKQARSRSSKAVRKSVTRKSAAQSSRKTGKKAGRTATRKKSSSISKTVQVDYLARVEGEGSLYVKIKRNRIEDLKFKIFEPPRFFEAFLRGRSYKEVPDITARICGICPIAYQMSSVHALEKAFGIKIEGPIRDLRRLIYCGEWIESHALHILMLHAPDFLGYEDVIQIAKDHPELVQKGLRLKKAGNGIVNILGGREIHPINVRVGGFYRIPQKKEFKALIEELKWAREECIQLVHWCASLPMPDFEYDYEFVALSHPSEYPFNEGRLVSNRGLDISVDEYDAHFKEEHVEHSTSLHSRLEDRGAYFVGPHARYNLNFNKLSKIAKETVKEIGFPTYSKNPFQSIVIRAIETLYAVDEALRILRKYEMPDQPAVPLEPHAATGRGVSEAPRGILYHRYSVGADGLIKDAKIVAPTSQNQKIIESDLYHFVSQYMDLPKDELTWKCEQAIRNYDPCISCSCHFLNLQIDRD